MLKQTAVYWGNPVNDGRGGFTYDDPVEVSCYWADRQELFMSATGRQELSRSVVHLLVAVELGGWLMLGELADLSTDIEEPSDVASAFQIRATAAIPSVSGLQTLYKAWL